VRDAQFCRFGCTASALAAMLMACQAPDRAPAPASNPPRHDAPTVDCAPDKKSPSNEQDGICAVLCGIPGGVEECPVGTPCPRDGSAKNGQGANLDQSLCARAGSAAKMCLPRR
jgi:hypothetical protein